jgi:hypothetical protein
MTSRRLCVLFLLAVATGCSSAPKEKGGGLDLQDKKEDGENDENEKPQKPGGTEIGAPNPDRPFEDKPDTLAAYAHSADTLYALELSTKKATSIGKFSCVTGDPVIDIAMDGKGAMFATTFSRFLSVDPKNASCKVLATGIDDEDQYPNSLSFVPAGTVDATKEALVGYAYHPVEGIKDTYVRIDTTTGKMSFLGVLNPTNATTRYESSGDLIALSNDGNRTFLTVRPLAGGTDRLAEIDPKTGVIKRIIGDTKQSNLYGLAYAGGKAYAFTDAGSVFSLDLTNGTAAAVSLSGAAGVLWNGATVTTIVAK